MMNCIQPAKARVIAAVFSLVWLAATAVAAQQQDSASVIAQVDAAVKARIDNVESYTVTEHYAVYRGTDETHPAAEMTVQTVYRQDSGKSYTILSESGSEFIRNHVLRTVLDNEKNLNLPGTVEHSWFTSANYEMQLKHGGIQLLDGRECLALAIHPKHKATNMIEGTLMVDAKDGSIVQLDGTASQSASIFTGPAQVMRHYVNLNGFSMATQARAVSDSYILGRTTVTIDYRDYQIQLRQAGVPSNIKGRM
jgi:outer membrane lipoprotein-sorting protein